MSEELGITVSKDENFSEWYTQIVQKAELVDMRYGIQGFIVHRPWAMRIIKRLYSLFEEQLDSTDHHPALFPLLIPEENLKKEKEHFGFAPEVFWVESAGSDKLENRYALRPTSETAMYPMYSLWIRSYRDLPLKYYQSVSVYRYEPTTRPFLRGIEFLWIESHDVFDSHESAIKQVHEDMSISHQVIEKSLGLYFIFFKRPQWDKFKGADDTYAADCMMPDGRVNQIATTHDLGQNFARAFGVKFKDENEKENIAWQTCFGIGIWRIMASLVAVYGDDKGLVLPPHVAPYQVVIVPIYKKGTRDKVIDSCENIKQEILNSNQGLRVHLDKRDEKSPGFKFNEWELRGVPLRIEVGLREIEQGKLTITRRDTGEKDTFQRNEATKRVADELEKMNQRAHEKSVTLYKKPIDVTTIKEAEAGSKKGIFLRAPFCSISLDGQKCSEKLKPFGLHVRGTPLANEEKASGKCIVCGKKASEMVYLARAY